MDNPSKIIFDPHILEQKEALYRKAILDNYALRWIGKLGLSDAHCDGVKFIKKETFQGIAVYTYSISIIEEIAAITAAKVTWEGHIGLEEAEKILRHLLGKGIVNKKYGRYYFSLEHKNITVKELDLGKLDSGGFFGGGIKKFANIKTATHVLRVLHDSIDFKKTKEVKIVRLGEAIASKSMVFRLVEIAGDYEVVKVSPTPLSWYEYYTDLKNQRAVSKMLCPEIHSLVPGVSYALSGNHLIEHDPKYRGLFTSQGYLSPIERDRTFGDTLLDQVNLDTRLQRYLQIAENHGYFMPYLKEGLLQHCFDEIHGYVKDKRTNILEIEAEIISEMKSDFSLVGFDSFPLSMKGKYRNLSGSMAEYIQQQYNTRERKGFDVFVACMKNPAAGRNHVSVYDIYVSIVRGHVRDRRLVSLAAKQKLQQLLVALLNLFAMLREKGIAIRDLKLANAYVSDNLDGNKMLDLLDLETAVIYKAGPHGKIPQPRLGGTPSRATPSQWFNNGVLREYYGDQFDRAFYFSDLFAIVDMIYSGITREPLFVNARKTLLDMCEVLAGRLDLEYFKLMTPKESNGELDDRTNIQDETTRTGGIHGESSLEDIIFLEIFKIVNPIFWKEATQDFLNGLSKNRDLLSGIRISLPFEVAEIMRHEISCNRQLLQRQLHSTPQFATKINSDIKRHDDLLDMPMTEFTADNLLKLLFVTTWTFMNRS